MFTCRDEATFDVPESFLMKYVKCAIYKLVTRPFFVDSVKLWEDSIFANNKYEFCAFFCLCFAYEVALPFGQPSRDAQVSILD